MAYSDSFGVEYSDDSTMLKKAPISLEGKYYVTDGTTIIAVNAFKGCENLTSIYLPASLKQIIGLADCKKLSAIYYSGTLEQWLDIDWSSLLSCGYDLFIKGELVTNVVIPSSVTEIKKNAFYYCKSIKSLILHNGVKKIGNSAFNKSGLVNKLNLNEGLETLGEYSFFNSAISEVEIPSSLNSIEYGSFSCCYSLNKFTVSAGNRKFNVQDSLLCDDAGKVYAFAAGQRYSRLELPECVSSFAHYVFAHDAYPLYGLYIPAGFEGDLSNVCSSCEKLTVYIPQGTIGAYLKKGMPEKQVKQYFNPSIAFLPGVNCIKAIAENPFRILGVCSNASQKEIIANSRKIKSYLKVGKSISFPLDLDAYLPPVIRTEEAVESALAALTNENDKLVYSLFWFVKNDSFDEIALGHLGAGNYDKAVEIFSKSDSWSSWLNLSIMYFLKKDFVEGLSHFDGFVTDNGCEYLLKACCSESFVLERDVFHIYADEFLKSCNLLSFQLLVRNYNESIDGAYTAEVEYLDNITYEKYSKVINEAIAVAKAIDSNDSNASLDAAKKLIDNTSATLCEYKSLVGESNEGFIRLSDRLAKQILQLGINYYNESEDDDKLENALPIQKYALDIAIGKMTKDRCQQNYDILLKHQSELPPKEVRSDCKLIFNELEKYNRLPDKISHAITLLNNTKDTIAQIKSKLGATNEFYLKISTLIVSNAIHNVIEEVNESQKNEVIEFRGIKIPITPENMTNEQKLRKLNLIKSTLREAWKATILMDGFDLETKFKNERYAPNREALKGLCQQMGVSTYVPTPRNTTSKVTMSSSTSTSRSTSQNKSTNSSKPSESIVAWIICIIIVEVIWGLIFVDSEGFWSGVLYSLMGWFILPINYGVTWLMLWIADKINE